MGRYFRTRNVKYRDDEFIDVKIKRLLIDRATSFPSGPLGSVYGGADHAILNEIKNDYIQSNIRLKNATSQVLPDSYSASEDWFQGSLMNQ